jgi:peptidoglycan/LPS O-acetylase OafA/YrhL
VQLLFPAFAPFFVAGMAFYLLQTNQEAKWKLYGLLGVSYLLAWRTVSESLAAWPATYHQPASPYSQLIGLGILSSFFVAFFLITQGYIRLGKSGWLAKAGAITYPIYLFHHNIGYVVLQHFGNRVDRNLLLGLMLVVLLVGAYAVHVLIEKPFSRVVSERLKVLTSPRAGPSWCLPNRLRYIGATPAHCRS